MGASGRSDRTGDWINDGGERDMIEIDDGGPAFPESRWDDKNGQEVQWCGMTLRDYFAAKALQSIILADGVNRKTENDSVDAIRAYAYADAMLAERSK